MAVLANDLWSLALDRTQIDPADLALAIEDQVRRRDLDFRSRLLIRDSLNALRQRWGAARLHGWLNGSAFRDEIEAIWKDDLGEPGFPLLARSIVEITRPETIQTLFRELGQKARLRKPITVHVAGSVALILRGLLARHTQDIDFINEVPAEIRSEHRLLDEFKDRYRLYLGHVQSHYFPSGWEARAQYFDTFGDLRVYLVDAYDVFLSKLCSSRTKDLDDLRMLVPQLDKEKLTQRLKDTTAALYAPEDLKKRAADNWYILYGEPLPQ
jgi:hypothetical protein